MKQLLTIVPVLFLLAFWKGCAPEAPHSNPLDPYRANSEIEGITLDGHVVRKTEPHQPLDSCLIFLTPGDRFTQTDADGEFQFRGLSRGVYRLSFQRAGFAPDTVTLATDTLSNQPVHFFLDGLPFLKTVHFYSEFIDQWWPDPVYRANLEIIAGDPDGASDITDVRVTIADLGIEQSLQTTALPDSFFLGITPGDLPDNDIFQLIGRELRIYLTDKSGARVESEPIFLHRIIDQSPQPLSPTALAVSPPRPVLQWQSFPANFHFTYEVSVFLINAAGLPVLLRSVTALPPDQLAYAYPDSLPTGTYFWTVGVRDDLENFSRSKEASFQVP